ncbi:tRNA lysidine(34) synthetase TilS [Litorivita pollutaquae]|uniref:tRNA lysidine(34) synthetase TilS n=1 Tax=Litorivita pollutaquae TaxID=2200892 RepID=UPI0026A6ECD4
MTGTDLLLIERVRSALQPRPPSRIGVAVSGGSDSAALLHLLHDFACDETAHGRHIALRAVTVDHGLRPESAQEAKAVGEMAEALGVAHDILKWTTWDGTGNMQDCARRARYRLMADWAASHDIHHIALGHTADDQAETVLMRLGRAAGVDGLAAMSPRRRMGGVTLLRPLLTVRRAALRKHLQARGIAWIDDPSNDNPAYERVRARRALRTGEAGLSVEALCTVAQNMAMVREALGWQCFTAARNHVRFDAGDVVIARQGFRALPVEVSRRILHDALRWVSGAEYGPRGPAMGLLLEALRGGTVMTLHGCQIVPNGTEIRIFREFQAVRALDQGFDPSGQALWDGRWQLNAPQGVSADGLRLRALGEAGLAYCRRCRAKAETQARAAGQVPPPAPARPHAALIASPAVWRGDALVSAPLAGCAEGWTAELRRETESYFTGFLE